MRLLSMFLTTPNARYIQARVSNLHTQLIPYFLLRLSGAPALLLDKTGIVLDATPGFLELTGYHTKEIVGANVNEFSPRYGTYPGITGTNVQYVLCRDGGLMQVLSAYCHTQDLHIRSVIQAEKRSPARLLER